MNKVLIQRSREGRSSLISTGREWVYTVCGQTAGSSFWLVQMVSTGSRESGHVVETLVSEWTLGVRTVTLSSTSLAP